MTTESLDTLHRVADTGDTDAMVRLGVRYLTAREAPPRPAVGIALIDRAAAAGHPQAQFLAATIASAGLWRARNWPLALDLLARAAQQGHGPALGTLRVLAGGPAGNAVSDTDADHLRRAVDMAAWLAPPPATLLRTAPRIAAIPAFAPATACEWLIANGREHLSRATIYDRVTGGTTEDGRRTNSQCDLDVVTGGVLIFLFRARITAVTGRPETAMEIPKILHYAPGETFAPHFDYLDPAEPAYAAELAARGQRVATFLVYLNDAYTGGETAFPRIGLSHRAARGDALLFANADEGGRPDEQTMHTGLPPQTGEKWVFSQWIRSLPAG